MRGFLSTCLTLDDVAVAEEMSVVALEGALPSAVAAAEVRWQIGELLRGSRRTAGPLRGRAHLCLRRL